MMKMVSEISLSWVENKMPLLKDIDIRRLCGFFTDKDDNKAKKDSTSSKDHHNPSDNDDDDENQKPLGKRKDR